MEHQPQSKQGLSQRHRTERSAVHEQLLSIQKKPAVSNPGDPEELEADAVARKVTSGESVSINGTNGSINRKTTTSPIQTKCAECEKLNGAEETEDHEHTNSLVQRKCEKCGASESLEQIGSNINRTKGNGQALPESTQKDLGGKMGADFSNVNIHTNDDAHKMNVGLGAKAFTHGQDIYFRKGEYNPESSSGKLLLAHELTHTVQQGKSGTNVQRQIDVDPGFGILTPAHFNFETLKVPSAGKNGGWRVACLKIRFNPPNPEHKPTTVGTECTMEVGVPVRSGIGGKEPGTTFSVVMAQAAAAEAGNAAGMIMKGRMDRGQYNSLTQSEEICTAYRNEFERELKLLIPGARVSRPGTNMGFTCKHSPPLVVYTCFIATAAYGSIFAEELTLLRAYRDHILSGSIGGRLATKVYYKISPPIASLIRRSDRLRRLTRKSLAPIVRGAKKKLEEHNIYIDTTQDEYLTEALSQSCTAELSLWSVG